ncbi:MAG: hypothetical protein KME59_21525 [Trichormus sp. ATA11-4-KO1]|jgi:hypothetical protein|nr:hypothetical protein [Trichormus sp. ATA11-4-KO1]
MPISYNTPGVYVNEATYGSIPAILNSHDAVYVLGSSTKSGAPVATPTYISNLDDFTNVFGASPSAAAIQLFFDQRSGYGLYFVNVLMRVERSLTVNTFTPGTILTLTIDGYAISYTTVTGDTDITARDALGNLVNTQLPLTASYYPDGTLRYADGVTVTASVELTLGVASTLTSPKVKDVSDTIKVAFEPEMRQGYLCAPEFFQAFTDQSDRTALALAMESLAADPDYYWVAVIDCGLTQATQITGGGAINAVIAERNTLASPRGNSWFYFPYLVNLTGTLVPPSLAAIGVALRRTRAEGFSRPPAGVGYPIYGVSDISFKVTKLLQGQLNPLGINCIRRLPAGRGIVVYGARTLSTSSFYRFGNTRVILNVLAGSLKVAFDALIFSLADGQGILFSRVKQTASAFCEILRLPGALFGSSPSEAYLVVCDLTNNTLDGLEAGQVNVDVVVKPSPTVEALVVTLSRASLGTVLAEVSSSGSTAPISRPSTSQTPLA